MTDQRTSAWRLLISTEHFAGHVAAVVAGVILMLAGLSMGVTMVLLPIGIPLGLMGVLLFMWGLFSYARRKET